MQEGRIESALIYPQTRFESDGGSSRWVRYACPQSIQVVAFINARNNLRASQAPHEDTIAPRSLSLCHTYLVTNNF